MRNMEKVFFYNSKNQKLCGIIEEPNLDEEEIVIIVHGYSSSKEGNSAKGVATKLTKRNINSFRIDLDGCGESEGDFAEQTITSAVDDIISAINLVKERGYKKIDLFGSSGGGLAVMAVALKYPEINRIALKAPCSDYPSQRLEKYGQDYIGEWRKKGFTYKIKSDGRRLRVNYSFYEDSKNYVMYDKVKDIKCPVLIIHGDADKTVNLEQSKKAVNNFPDAKLIVLRGADHHLAIDGDCSLSNKIFADWFEGKEVHPHCIH